MNGSGQEILTMAIILLLSVPLLSLVGLPIMVIVGQILSILRKRSAYAKCARQITNLSLILGFVICLVGIAALWLRHDSTLFHLIKQIGANFTSVTINTQDPEVQNITWKALFSATPDMVNIQADIIICLTLLAATALMVLVKILWPQWEEKRIIHQSLAIVSSFWYALAAYGVVCVLSAHFSLSFGIAYPTSLESFFMPSFETSFWSSGPYLPPLAFSLAGSLASVWLIIRRNYDDFGRDYYAGMLKWCAAWARAAWFVLWFMFVGTTILQWVSTLRSENFLTSPDFIYGAMFLLLWLIPGILWSLAIRSATPLRHKMTLVLALMLSMCIIIPLYMSMI